MTFTLTPKAEKFIRLMLMSDGKPGAGFRMAVSPGGCSGLNAEIEVLAEPLPGDKVVQMGSVTFFLPAESRILLDGVTVDFTDTAAKTGLVFHDPKATGTCSSHAAPVSH